LIVFSRSSIPRSCSTRPNRRQSQEAWRLHSGHPSGERTAEHIDYVLSRITVLGAVYLAIVCLIPDFDLLCLGAVLFRRKLAFDRGQRDHGYGGAGAGYLLAHHMKA